MKGKDSVLLLSDMRAGENMYATVQEDMLKCFPLTKRAYLLCCGLNMHVNEVARYVRSTVAVGQLELSVEMNCPAIAANLAAYLYEKRFSPFMVSPIIAGLTIENKPYICGFDLIGTQEESSSFIASGTGCNQITGACETLWREGLSDEDLFNVGVTAFKAGLNRDCLSGWGVKSFLISPQKITVSDIELRMD